MKIIQLPATSESYQPLGNTWVPVMGSLVISEDAILYIISEDGGQELGRVLADPTCTAMRECSLTVLDMTCVSRSKNTAIKVLSAFEEYAGAQYEAAYVVLSALYEKALGFWQDQGYQQITDLLHGEDDVVITLGKLLPRS